ncbi:hypothetical protein [Mycobacteroides abscessus]|nr:hypothetical protein [Mycobacteroides abscessus]
MSNTAEERWRQLDIPTLASRSPLCAARLRVRTVYFCFLAPLHGDK